MVLEIVSGYELSIRNSAVQARDHPRGGSPRTPSILACLLQRTLCHSTTWRSSRNRAWARAGARDLRAPPQGSGLRTHMRSGHRGGTALPRGGWWSNPLLRGCREGYVRQKLRPLQECRHTDSPPTGVQFRPAGDAVDVTQYLLSLIQISEPTRL